MQCVHNLKICDFQLIWLCLTQRLVNVNDILTTVYQEPQLRVCSFLKLKPVSNWNCWVIFLPIGAREITFTINISQERGRLLITLPAGLCAAQYHELRHTRLSKRRNHVSHSQSIGSGVTKFQNRTIDISHRLATSPLEQCTHYGVTCDTWNTQTYQLKVGVAWQRTAAKLLQLKISSKPGNLWLVVSDKRRLNFTAADSHHVSLQATRTMLSTLRVTPTTVVLWNIILTYLSICRRTLPIHTGMAWYITV